MSVALVTGSGGFVGSHLLPVLAARGWAVVGLGRGAHADPAAGRYVRADVTDEQQLTQLIGDVRPELIFHLAAAVPQKEPDAAALVRSVVSGTRAVGTAILRAGLATRLVLAGSSAQYGESSLAYDPLTEDAPCRPLSSYGYAKLAAEAVAFGLSLDGSFELVAARAFNHIGPGEPSTTVAGAIASRIAAVLDGRAQRVSVSDLAVVRDFTDVRDIAKGYLALAERGVPGRVYNICSGRGTSVGQVLDGLLEAAHLDRSVIEPLPARGDRPPRQVGSPSRAQADTGWSARIPLNTSLHDLLLAARRVGNPAREDSERPVGAG